MSYPSRFQCPYCGEVIRVRWWRVLAHRLRWPHVIVFWFGVVLSVLASGSAAAPDEVQDDLIIACAGCGTQVVVPED